MSSLQRILRVHTKRLIPICLEVAFGPKPQGSWSAFGCSDELLAAQQGGGQPRFAEPPRPSLGFAPCSLLPGAHWDLQHLAGLPLAGLAGLRSSHLLPWPQ